MDRSRTPSSRSRPARGQPLDPGLCARIRASILLAAPLLARFGQVNLPPPGGDVIGRRRVDTHFLALEAWARVLVGERYEIEARRLAWRRRLPRRAQRNRHRERADGGGAARGTTVLRNAAAEPHVQDLARFLVAMGARSRGSARTPMTVQGGRPLAGPRQRDRPRSHRGRDRFIGLAAVTNGQLTIDGRPGSRASRSTLLGFDRLGIRCPARGRRPHGRPGPGARDPARSRRPRSEARGPSLAGLPGGPDVDRDRDRHPVRRDDPDLREDVRVAPVLRRQADRDGCTDRALRSPPRRGRGPVPAPRRRVESPDIRAGMAMLLAALAAEGASTIHNVGQIERGYEQIDARLRALGAEHRAGRRLTPAAVERRADSRSPRWSNGRTGSGWWRASPPGAGTRCPRIRSTSGLRRRRRAIRDPLGRASGRVCSVSPAWSPARQVHGTRVRWHAAAPGWTILEGADGHATAAGTASGRHHRRLRPGLSGGPGPPGDRPAPFRAGAARRRHAGGGLARSRRRAGASGRRRSSCGVGICGDCYEVGAEVPVACGAPVVDGGSAHLDLAMVIRQQAGARRRPRYPHRPGARPTSGRPFSAIAAPAGRTAGWWRYLGLPVA